MVGLVVVVLFSFCVVGFGLFGVFLFLLFVVFSFVIVGGC